MKDRFYEEINKSRSDAAKNSVFLKVERYNKLIDDVMYAKTCDKKEPRMYWLLKRYDILEVQNKRKLIFPMTADDVNVLYYVTDEELYDVIHNAHVSIGHGGRDRMIKELSRKFKNITRHDVEIYLQLCEPCEQKRKGVRKGIVVKPMVFSEFNSRCQVDLIDFQSQPDGDFKFIMVYQDHLTKFVVLNALKTKRAEEVAYKLIDIFTLLGAPSILQSDNGREFANNIVSNLKEIWPDLHIVHGKPRHSQSQGSVERANQDIENMLTTWMQDNNNCHWKEGLRFVQLMKNRAFHSGIKRSPYEALFGRKMKVGLKDSNLAQDLIQNVENEEDLDDVINSIQNSVSDGPQQATLSVTSKNNDKPMSLCCVCSKEGEEFIACHKCNCFLHATCGESNTSDVNFVLCVLCSNSQNTISQQAEAKESLVQQAKKMKRNSELKFPPVEVGATGKCII